MSQENTKKVEVDDLNLRWMKGEVDESMLPLLKETVKQKEKELKELETEIDAIEFDKSMKMAELEHFKNLVAEHADKFDGLLDAQSDESSNSIQSSPSRDRD